MVTPVVSRGRMVRGSQVESITLNSRVLVSQLWRPTVKGDPPGDGAGAARPAPAWPAERWSTPPGPCSSSAATRRRPSTPSATTPTSRRRPCTGCSPRSSGSSRPCSTSPSPATTRQLSVAGAPPGDRAPRRARPRASSSPGSPASPSRSTRGAATSTASSRAHRARTPRRPCCSPTTSTSGTTAKARSPARSLAPAPSGPGYANATPPTSSMR